MAIDRSQKQSSRHSRKISGLSVPAVDEPTSTTKALLVRVTSPRIFVAPRDSTNSEPSESGSRATTKELDRSLPLEEMFKEPEPTRPQEYILKEQELLSTAVEDEDDEATIATSTAEIEDQPTEEEKAAVQDGSELEDAKVNMEKLIMICFKNLLAESHLMNVPVYTIVHQLEMDGPEADPRPTEWIQLEVMARESSLGVILERLERIGVGVNVGTTSVYAAELCKSASRYAHMNSNELRGDGTDTDEDEEDPDSMRAEKGTLLPSDAQNLADQLKNEQAIEAARAEWKNAATRLRIEQVRELIVESAAFSLDFIALLVVASILAGIGLITDNSVVIVASMLVSPIMGPVLGLTFGTRIKDYPLVKSSFYSETLALLGCVIIGALVGLGSSFTRMAEDTWPTLEMENRGEPSSLLTGIAIAIPSGMGVCLSILNSNTSSLVGVAISASLLPPAVNAGICLVYAFFLAVGAVENEEKSASEFAVIGSISFALTAINILCIWISGIVMFEIKEVVVVESKSAFWAKDLEIARKLNSGKGEKPPPVDISVLQEGVTKAYNKKHPERRVENVKIKKPPKRHVGYSLSDAWAVSPRVGSPTAAAGGSMSSWGDGLFSPTPPEEQVGDNVRYVGLEDMGKLLGFDQEDEYEIDHGAVATRIGRGRYL